MHFPYSYIMVVRHDCVDVKAVKCKCESRTDSTRLAAQFCGWPTLDTNGMRVLEC